MEGIIFYSANIERAESLVNELECKDYIKYSVKGIDCSEQYLKGNIKHIVFPWDSRWKVWPLLVSVVNNIKIATYNDDFYCELDDLNGIKLLSENARTHNNWAVCKGINEVILFANVLYKKTILSSFPVKLQIETTDICNAKCIMCSHANHPGSGIDLIDNGLIEHIRELLPYLRVVVLHGNGEPFINKKLPVLLKELAKYEIKFICNTNLSIINDELIHFLKEDFIELNISCDAHTKQLYESIRRGLDFDVFKENIRTIRTACPSLCLKMAVVVMRQNIPYLSDIVKFASAMGFNEIVLNQLCVDRENNNLGDAPYLIFDDYKNAIQKAKETAAELGLVIKTPNLENTKSISMINKNGVKTVSGICDWLVESPFINLRGDVGICCINQKYIVGNIFENKFMDIWNDTPYRDIRSEFYRGNLPNCCQGCDFLLQDNLRYIEDNKTSIVKNIRG